MTEHRPTKSGPTLHLLEPPRASGAGRESSLFAWAERRRAGRIEPGPVIVVGDSMSARWVRAHGITFDARLAAPAGRTPLLWPAIRRLVRAERPSAVRCWSPALLRLCSWAPGLAGVELHATVVEGPGPWDERLASRVGRVGSIETFDESDARAWRSLGAGADVVDLEDPPGTSAPGERERLQAELGVAPDELLLGTLFDHPSDTDARRLSFLLAILAVSERRAVGMAPSGARLTEAGRRYARVINREYRTLFSDRPLVEQLRALDACVIPDPTRAQARGAARLLRRAAEAAGVRAFDRPEYAGLSGPTPPR